MLNNIFSPPRKHRISLFAEGEGRKTKMESCNAVEREVDRVLSKFGGLRDHSKKNLEELISSIQNIQRELNEGNHFYCSDLFVYKRKVNAFVQNYKLCYDLFAQMTSEINNFYSRTTF